MIAMSIVYGTVVFLAFIAMSAFIVATMALVKVIAMEKSTHQVQYVPMEDFSGSEKAEGSEFSYEEDMEEEGEGGRRSPLVPPLRSPKKREEILQKKLNDALGISEEEYDSII